MSANLTGLPPSALARLNAIADIQAVAVKLINVPDGLRNNPAPVKLAGTVIGQSPDGSVQVQTDKGVLNVMLKDRQSLPQGLKLEIDLPAGRSPQQAMIRNAPEAAAPPAPTNSPASLAATLSQTPLSSATTAASLKLDRTSSLKATEIEDALRAASPKLADMVAALKAPPAPLLAGQNVRLIPLPPGQPQIMPMTQEALLAAIAAVIQDIPETQIALKGQLTELLSRMNLSSLQIPSPDGESAPVLPPQMQKLLQAFETQKSPGNKNNPELQLRYVPIQQLTPSKPVDVQIAALSTLPLKVAVVPGQVIPTLAEPILPGQIQIAPKPAPAITVPVSNAATTPPSPALPAAPVATPSVPVLPPQVLPGQITGFTRENLPIVTFNNPQGGQPISYVVQFTTGNLQVGSPILVTMLPESTSIQIPGTVLPPVPLGTWLQPGLWDSLTDLVQTIHQINPGIAHTISQILPQPTHPQNMGGLALFFLSVLRSGDMESWMSPQVANLLRLTGKSDALRAVASDIALTARSENLALAQDWRATMFPLYHDQQVHRVPLYYKHQSEEDGDDQTARRSKMMRFLFDLKLARMGNVQIDGFMQPERLDMIMRTKSPLSTPMQRTMQGLYTKAMDKSNLHGELTFQFKPEHWLSMEDRIIDAIDKQKTPDHMII